MNYKTGDRVIFKGMKQMKEDCPVDREEITCLMSYLLDCKPPFSTWEIPQPFCT